MLLRKMNVRCCLFNAVIIFASLREVTNDTFALDAEPLMGDTGAYIFCDGNRDNRQSIATKACQHVGLVKCDRAYVLIGFLISECP